MGTSLLVILFFLSISVVIGLATAQLITNGTIQQGLSEEDIEQMIDETIEEITSYIVVKDKLGKFTGPQTSQRIDKIGILIKTLVTHDINLSQLKIKINNDQSVSFLNYSYYASWIKSHSLFNHPIWKNLSGSGYGVLVINDDDGSVVNHHCLNKNTDMVYLLLNLTADYQLRKGDDLIVTLFPSSGLQKTITLTAPLPMNQVIMFE